MKRKILSAIKEYPCKVRVTLHNPSIYLFLDLDGICPMVQKDLMGFDGLQDLVDLTGKVHAILEYEYICIYTKTGSTDDMLDFIVENDVCIDKQSLGSLLSMYQGVCEDLKKVLTSKK